MTFVSSKYSKQPWFKNNKLLFIHQTTHPGCCSHKCGSAGFLNSVKKIFLEAYILKQACVGAMNLGWPHLSQPLRHPVCRPIVPGRPAELSTFLRKCTPAVREYPGIYAVYSFYTGDVRLSVRCFICVAEVGYCSG